MRKRTWVLLLSIVAAGVTALVLVWLSFVHPEALRIRMETFLTERLDSDVEMAEFGAHPLPTLSVDGSELVLKQHGDTVPFIEIKEFEVHAGPLGLFRQPRRIDAVRLDGVRVLVRPRPAGTPDDKEKDDTEAPDASWKSSPAIVLELVAENARLELASRNPAKPPRMYDIHRVVLKDASLEGPTRFDATLSIPTPPGDVKAQGRIERWMRRDPGRTRVDGEYVFKDADLGTFKGISGILTSTGQFAGPLERLEVRGRTETPDFALTSAGNRMPLTTEFDAVVDGTSGDTILNSVRAVLGRSHIATSGRVVRAREVKGRLIKLDVHVDRARLEDLLRLAVKGDRPPMTGAVRAKAQMELPPGAPDVIDRLRLAGSFQLGSARFNDFDVQKAVATLSHRGRGINANETPPPGDRVVSNMSGDFSLVHGVMRFSKLTFSVPGAKVRLAGTFHLKSEALNFTGVLITDASISEMTTGWKSVFAKLADLWFRRNGETVIPIRIAGHKDKPEFGLDARRALRRKMTFVNPPSTIQTSSRCPSTACQ
jgi:AsmA-like C-terminal region